MQPYEIGAQAQATANTYYTICNITGTGICSRISFTNEGLDNNRLTYKITIDGVEYEKAAVGQTYQARVRGLGIITNTASRNSAIDLTLNCYFKSSLKVEVKSSADGAYLGGIVNYALE